jgi:hypothetical protein
MRGGRVWHAEGDAENDHGVQGHGKNSVRANRSVAVTEVSTSGGSVCVSAISFPELHAGVIITSVRLHDSALFAIGSHQQFFRR